MKLLIYISASVGGIIGSYIPVMLWHAGMLSGWSVIGGIVGTLAGIWPGIKLGQYFDV